jgi:hypothetical protein
VREFKKWEMDVESMILDGYIRHYLKKDPLSVRELAIQNSKLRRMILLSSQKDDPRVAGLGVFGGRSSKKMAKERGKREKAIGQQHKKVCSLWRGFIGVEVKKLDASVTPSDIRVHIAFIEKHVATSVQRIIGEQMIAPPNS